jgi:hypothetical protein
MLVVLDAVTLDHRSRWLDIRQVVRYSGLGVLSLPEAHQDCRKAVVGAEVILRKLVDEATNDEEAQPSTTSIEDTGLDTADNTVDWGTRGLSFGLQRSCLSEQILDRFKASFCMNQLESNFPINSRDCQSRKAGNALGTISYPQVRRRG